ncbi:TetR/AcrR family transcriptional regulator [Streptosporangium sandarakinum]|uniref:TetR/AcrR family transcriptional regulator n=1 Tax=Streptosporangium sandarakinum TaxID=1260955 RepID=UPI00341904B8
MATTPNEQAPHDDPQATLAEEQKNAARRHILRIARSVGASRGIKLRMEDVAEAAGVSRRTLFRYFGTRTELIRQSFADGIAEYARRIPAPEAGESPREWLHRAVRASHNLNSHIGRLWWDLAAGADDAEGLQGVFNPQARGEIIRTFLMNSWRIYGGHGEPPEWLFAAYCIHMSAFSTQILTGDCEYDMEQATEITTTVLECLVIKAINETPASRD